MVSGGFDKDRFGAGGDDISGFEKGVNSVGRGVGKAGKKLRKGASKILKKGAKTTENTIKTILNPKRLVVILLLSLVIMIIFMISNYYATGENDGAVDQYFGSRNGGTSSSDGFQIKEYSNSNAACIAYYQLLSREKSIWQEIKDDDGNVLLIRQDDARAVTDYFNNDKAFYLEPDLLFCLNKAIFSEEYVFPEAFLKPVAYDETEYKLKDLVDEKGSIVVVSPKYNKDKEKIGEDKNVSDFGLASVLKYKKESKTKFMRTVYDKEDYYDSSTKTVKQRSITPETYDDVIETEEIDVLDKAITFAGEVSYNYEPTTVKVGNITSGTSNNREDNVDKIFYKKETVVRYVARIKDTYTILYFYSVEDMLKYCEANPEYEPFLNPDGSYRTASKIYNLYKYKSPASGEYVSFVNQSSKETNDLGNKYLYDYLKNFSTYKPAVSRSYDPLKDMQSQADSFRGYKNAVTGLPEDSDALGGGETKFEKCYNGGRREVIDRLWDALIQWGYTEEQAAAVMGNLTIESMFDCKVVNKTSGAKGLCQWLKDRLDMLSAFAASYNGADWSDMISQIQFACMELDPINRYAYCKNQWLCSKEYKEIWIEGKDVEELTKVMALGWERFATQDQYEGKRKHSELSRSKIISIVKERQENAKAAFEILSGKAIEYEIDVIEPIGTDGDSDTGDGNGRVPLSTTKGMTKADRERFSKFYHAVDDDGNSGIKYNFYSRPLTTDEVNTALLRTNSYINNTSLREENLNSVEALWTSNYLTDLSDSKNFAETLDSVVLAEVSELKEYGFMFPIDLSATPCFTDKFCQVRSFNGTSHKGVDIACKMRTPVYAVSGGVVTLSRFSESAGNYIIINHISLYIKISCKFT